MIHVILDDLFRFFAGGWGTDMADVGVEDISGINAGFAAHGVEDGARWTGERYLSGDLVFARGFADHIDRGGGVAFFDERPGHTIPSSRLDFASSNAWWNLSGSMTMISPFSPLTT